MARRGDPRGLRPFAALELEWLFRERAGHDESGRPFAAEVDRRAVNMRRVALAGDRLIERLAEDDLQRREEPARFRGLEVAVHFQRWLDAVRACLGDAFGVGLRCA